MEGRYKSRKVQRKEGRYKGRKLQRKEGTKEVTKEGKQGWKESKDGRKARMEGN